MADCDLKVLNIAFSQKQLLLKMVKVHVQKLLDFEGNIVLYKYSKSRCRIW